METIVLRVVGHKKNGKYFAICLETDIAIQADSRQEVKSKMKDALSSYFKSFKSEEIGAGEFIRKAPIRYRFEWYILVFIHFTRRVFHSTAFQINYEPNSRQLSIA